MTSSTSGDAERSGADIPDARGRGAPAAELREVGHSLASSRSHIERALQTYDETEPLIHAFAWLDRDRAMAQANERDNRPRLSALHGVPIAVKDIFDTRGIPTERGSSLFAGRVPPRSADVVRRLELAGAIVLGKTVTTEFAYYEPGPTRNPWRLSRTPGGSSQGSAAAVSAGVVAGAIGSQTNGSTIRPAAYCGVVGFKPTKGLISTEGGMPFARSLDHVGLFARTVRDVTILAAGIGLDVGSNPSASAPRRLLGLRGSDWAIAEPAMRERLEAVGRLVEGAGNRVEWVELPALDRAAELVGLLMAYESARGIGREALRKPELVGRQALDLFQRGLDIAPAEYAAAKAARRRLIEAFEHQLGPTDAILTLAAAGEAPDLHSTGDPRFCSRWSLLGAPAISIPAGLGPSGLPLGIQLVGARRGDQRLLETAEWLEGIMHESLVA